MSQSTIAVFIPSLNNLFVPVWFSLASINISMHLAMAYFGCSFSVGKNNLNTLLLFDYCDDRSISILLPSG